MARRSGVGDAQPVERAFTTDDDGWIALDDVARAAARGLAPLGAELAGFALLEATAEACSTMRSCPRGRPTIPIAPVELRVWVQSGGQVALEGLAGCRCRATVARALRRALATILGLTNTSTPALMRCTRHGREADDDVEALHQELLAALIPLNREACRRGLSRAARGAREAFDRGLLESAPAMPPPEPEACAVDPEATPRVAPAPLEIGPVPIALEADLPTPEQPPTLGASLEVLRASLLVDRPRPGLGATPCDFEVVTSLPPLVSSEPTPNLTPPTLRGFATAIDDDLDQTEDRDLEEVLREQSAGAPEVAPARTTIVRTGVRRGLSMMIGIATAAALLALGSTWAGRSAPESRALAASAAPPATPSTAGRDEKAPGWASSIPAACEATLVLDDVPPSTEVFRKLTSSSTSELVTIVPAPTDLDFLALAEGHWPRRAHVERSEFHVDAAGLHASIDLSLEPQASDAGLFTLPTATTTVRGEALAPVPTTRGLVRVRVKPSGSSLWLRVDPRHVPALPCGVPVELIVATAPAPPSLRRVEWSAFSGTPPAAHAKVTSH